MSVQIKTVASQPSWVIRSKTIELAVTCIGGHMAPVTFCRRDAKPIQPYYVNPWHGEGLKIDDPVLRPLRGDFFCMPFGANAKAYRGKQFCCHGEPATAKWKLADFEQAAGISTLTLKMRTRIRAGEVTKRLRLVDGQNVIYSTDELKGFSGRMPVGHHATLAVPETPGAMRIATSPFRYGLTPPSLIGDPAIGHYQSLAVGRKFTSLERVPLMWRDDRWADLTTLPARRGFTDFVATFDKVGPTPSWTTAVNAEGGYLWFSLKDASVLPTTAIWISNRGRHTIPWCGRNACVGLEDVCGYFAEGLVPSVRANELSADGIPTAIKLSPRKPTNIHYIQGAMPIKAGFKQVERVEFEPGRVVFHSTSGKKLTAEVDWEFLQTGLLGGE